MGLDFSSGYIDRRGEKGKAEGKEEKKKNNIKQQRYMYISSPSFFLSFFFVRRGFPFLLIGTEPGAHQLADKRRPLAYTRASCSVGLLQEEPCRNMYTSNGMDV